jgi:hypothetical protein
MIQYDKILKIIQSTIIILIGIVGATQFVLTNNLVIYGEEITENDRKVNEYKHENTVLIKQIAQETALSVLISKAKLHGFTTPSTIVSLSAEYPVAIRP